MSFNHVNIATEIDTMIRQVVQSFEFENKVFEAFPFEALTNMKSYGVDRLKIIGKENFSVLGDGFSFLATGTSAREQSIYKTTKAGKMLVINEDEWTTMSEFARVNHIQEHVQGMMNVAKRLLTTGEAMYINEKGEDIKLTISNSLVNLGTITQATGGYFTDNSVKIFLDDLKQAIARITDVSDELTPDTLYISKKLWGDLLVRNATTPQTNMDLETTIAKMGLTVIDDGSLNKLGALNTSFVVYQKNPNLVRGFCQEQPQTTPEGTSQDISKTFVKQHVGGLHNLTIDDAVQIVKDCKQ